MRRIDSCNCRDARHSRGGVIRSESRRGHDAQTPAGILAAIDGTNLVQDIAVACRRVWRCGPVWLRLASCLLADRPRYYGGYGFYGGGPYYGGPYYYGGYRRYGW